MTSNRDVRRRRVVDATKLITIIMINIAVVVSFVLVLVSYAINHND